MNKLIKEYGNGNIMLVEEIEDNEHICFKVIAPAFNSHDEEDNVASYRLDIACGSKKQADLLAKILECVDIEVQSKR